LDKNLAIQKGQSLLVRGATTTLGLAAITYAKARGFNVVATTRNGADQVIIDDGNIAEKVRAIFPEGVDCALEVVGIATIRDTVKTVKHWGQVCVVGVLSGAPVLDNFDLHSDLPNTVKISFFSSGLLGSSQMLLTDSPMKWITEQLENKKMPSLLSKIYEFDQIRDAHQVIENDQALGKIVIKL